MFANYRTPHEFNIDERSALATFADYAAIAIRNARNFQELQEARRLATIGTSAAAMAHRMRTPLQNILTTAELLREDLEGSGSATSQNIQDIHDIAEAVIQMDDAIERVRRAAKPIVPDLDHYSIEEIVRHSFTEHSYFAQQLQERGIQAEIVGLNEIRRPTIRCDRNLLEEAISNLVGNALEAVPEEGRIAVSVWETNGDLCIEVQDDGPGVDEGVLKDLFEPFHTTKRGGLGLGLFIVHRNVEAHGGNVSYQQKEKGACFQIDLPRRGRRGK
jgi:signal transduction histidine kinase